jgi:hypothetical protein
VWDSEGAWSAAKLFIQTEPTTDLQQRFPLEFNQWETPFPNAIHQWVRQWHEEGSPFVKNHWSNFFSL